ncbi:flagellar basal body rod protein [Fredinandcohnia quinoae]|uniref:Flagellar basal body rod protein n=1 Tax=Fredinandcohnia quinoae TaxID=2918902 RepID=A0AAW5E0Q3_9BACI|nr:flagellar basal body rod protein [Fredinandcohnia sp. SECRCQ15]MCH1624274.1 flagellar basal body rod protein [Fredinandcohnia sp. SECRCQ15]
MKKFGLFIVGGIAALVLLSQVGPMVGLIISLAILYFAYKQFTKSDSTGGKILWGIVGLIALSASISNVPAILGIVAAYILYVVYKKWNREKTTVVTESSDPFTNFEKQWAELNK